MKTTRSKDELLALADRLESVRAQKGWSAREWSRRAKLSESHVGTIISKARAGEGGKEVSFSTLRDLALVAGVSVEWLMTGAGNPAAIPLNVDNTDRYFWRGLVILGAKLTMYSDEAIQHVLSLDVGDVDPGRDHWFAELQAAESRVKRTRDTKNRRKMN